MSITEYVDCLVKGIIKIEYAKIPDFDGKWVDQKVRNQFTYQEEAMIVNYKFPFIHSVDNHCIGYSRQLSCEFNTILQMLDLLCIRFVFFYISSLSFFTFHKMYCVSQYIFTF
uniref:DUF4216 domain-containing protein n=1 Tax=Heterorhabditis bacteriophora TaxID=37862 RepID=A0A1I7WJY9_HETBA